MPYFIFELEERVIADGQNGSIIAIGSSHNKSAHYLVRLDGKEQVTRWYSKDEVEPEAYWKEKKGKLRRWWRLGF